MGYLLPQFGPVRDLGFPLAAGFGTGVAVAASAPDPLFGLALGSALGLAVGLHLRPGTRLKRSADAFGELRVPLTLAAVPELQRLYGRYGRAVIEIAARLDPAYRELATARLDRLGRELETLAAGVIPFQTTETWRVAYESLLRSPGLYLYRSVAWVRTPDYWRDEPGRKSLALNYELHDEGRLSVERIVILADDL